jgi:DNA-binding NarL/FixJ family response regulator
MAIDVQQLPAEAEKLGDLTERERVVLALLRTGLTSREIAQRMAISEATVYVIVAGMLAALEYERPAVSADAIHRRAGSRPATPDEVAHFHEQFGPFPTDDDG